MIGGVTGALAWKEWRALRGLMLANIGLCLMAMLVLSFAPTWANQRWVLSFAFFVIGPIFGAACGATTIAGERADRTISYLLSRPVSRLRVFFTKVFTAGMIWIAVIGCWGFVVGLLPNSTGGSLLWELSQAFGEEWMIWAAFSLLVFSCAVAASTVLEQTMTAAAGGFALAAVLTSMLYMIWGGTSFFLFVSPLWVAVEVLVLGLLLLSIACLGFIQADSTTGSLLKQRPLLVVIMLLSSVALVVIPQITRALIVDPDDLVLMDPRLLPDGSAVVTWGLVGNSRQMGVRLIPTDGRPAVRLTRGLTALPIFRVENGLFIDNRIYYFSARNLFGMMHDEFQLRVVGFDGSSDQAVRTEGSISIHSQGFIQSNYPLSNDGRWFLSENSATHQLRFIPLASRPDDSFRVTNVDLGGGAVADNYGHVGWTEDNRALYVRRNPPASVISIDPSNGGIETIYRREGAQLLPLGISDPMLTGTDGLYAGRLLLMEIEKKTDDGHRKKGVVLLDPSTGEVEQLIDQSCGFRMGADRRERYLIYMACAENPNEERRGFSDHYRLVLRDLKSGQEEVLETREGRPIDVRALALSPDAGHVAVETGTRIEILPIGDGQPRTMMGVRLVGWSDRHHLVVAGNAEFMGFKKIMMLDVRDDSRVTIFP